MIVYLPDVPAMMAFGARIAARLRRGDVVALSGAVGAGKTTLARAIIAAAGYPGEVPSPTFTILEAYDSSTPPLIHADFYRLRDPIEATELGLDEYRENAALIAEWPERAGGFASEASCLSVALDRTGEGRRAIVEGGKAWQGRLP